jgi:hypothetical protein
VCRFLEQKPVSELAASLMVRRGRRHSPLGQLLFAHAQVEFHLFAGASLSGPATKDGGKANTEIDPELFKHHGSKGSMI